MNKLRNRFKYVEKQGWGYPSVAYNQLDIDLRLSVTTDLDFRKSDDIYWYHEET